MSSKLRIWTLIKHHTVQAVELIRSHLDPFMPYSDIEVSLKTHIQMY